MALRARLTLLSALIVGVTLVLASLVAYAAVRSQLRGQVDDALRGNAAFYQGRAARAAGRRRPGARASARRRPASAAPAATCSSCAPTARRSSSAPRAVRRSR